ncbi:MAG: MATE family efflux transporter [Clostridia bacterium]|nr:MATE family efflux transporter [Clostridia bacterium]
MENKLITGPVMGTLVRFLVPMILTGLLQQSYTIVDSIILGNFVGEHALGSITCSYVVIDLFLMALIGMAGGCTILTAHLIGRGERDRLASLARAGMIAIGVTAAVCAVLGMVFSTPFLRLLDTPTEILNTSSQYMAVAMLGLPFIGLYNMAAGLVRGMGNSRIPLYGIMISSGLNIGLDLLFVAVFGWGIMGAAAATVISQVVSAAYLATAMVKDTGMNSQTKADWRLFGEGMRLALPQIAPSGFKSFGRVLLQDVMNAFGAVVVNGIGTAYKVDSVIMIPMMNTTTAVAVFTGQNIAAGNKDRCKKGLWCSILLNVCYALLAVVTLLFVGRPLIGIFGVTPAVKEIAFTFLLLMASFYILFGVGNVFSGYLQGIKDVTAASMIASSGMGVRVVFSYLLRGWIGWYVVAVAEILSWVSSAGLFYLRYRIKTKSRVDGTNSV